MFDLNIFRPPEPQNVQPSNVICVIGRRGSGKTTLVKYYLLPRLQPFIIYDSIGEYSDIENCSLVESESDLFDLLEARANIRIVPGTGGGDLEKICYILQKGVQNYHLFVDEFHVLYDHHMTFAADNPNFKKLVLLGRHKGLGVIISTQRPTDIPKYVLSQATVVYCFHVYHKQDVTFLSNIVNEAAITSTLNTYEFFEIQLGTPFSITRKKLKI